MHHLKEIQLDFWSPKHIIKEIKYLVQEHNIYNIKIPNEMFVLNPNKLQEYVMKLLKKVTGDKLNF